MKIITVFQNNEPDIYLENKAAILKVENINEDCSGQSRMIKLPILVSYDNNLNVRYWNADGSELNFCGHGSIALAKELRNSGILGEVCIYPNSKIFISKITLFIKEKSLSLQLKLVEAKKRNKFFYTQIGDCVQHVSKDYLLKYRPDFEKLRSKLLRSKSRLFIIYFFDSITSSYFVRVFAPHIGLNEDTVCGSGMLSVASITKLSGKVIYPYNNYYGSKMGGRYSVSIDNDVFNLISNE